VVTRIGWSAVEDALRAGRVCCPDCDRPLSPHGFAREREVRLRYGSRLLTPRRGICRPCARTHVLLPAFCVPRRRDGVEVIGLALLGAASGEGHRTIAARLDRPPGTVRGWLRAFARRSDQLRQCAVRWTIELGDADALPRRPAGSPIADALEALACAARAWLLRCGPARGSPWELAVALTGGRLLHGDPPAPGH
jgi:hypothetical protein